MQNFDSLRLSHDALTSQSTAIGCIYVKRRQLYGRPIRETRMTVPDGSPVAAFARRSIAADGGSDGAQTRWAATVYSGAGHG